MGKREEGGRGGEKGKGGGKRVWRTVILPLRSVGGVAADVEDAAFDGYVGWEVGVGAWRGARRCGPLVSLRCLRDLAQRNVTPRHDEYRLHDAEPRGLKSHRKAGSLPSHLDKCWTLMGSFFGGLRWTGVLGSKFLGSGTCPEDIVVVGKGWGVRGGWWWGSLACEDGKTLCLVLAGRW